MIRGLIFCVIACGAAAPALAGERSAALVTPSLLAAPALPVSVHFPGFDGALTISGDFVVRLRSMPAPTTSLAEFESRPTPHFDIAPADAIEPVTLVSPYAATELHALKSWRVTDRLGPTTTSANGFYAVRDVLMDHRKPRVYRPSAFSTMLVLRLDGKDESPSFSVGGGGVAAALWRAMPQ